MQKTLKTALAAAALLISNAALAVPVTFYGMDQNPGGVVPVGGNAETARNSFLSNLTTVGNEDFSSFAVGTGTPLTLSFPGSSGNLTADMSSSGGTVVVSNSSGAAVAGQFNTSSPNHLDAGFGSTLTIDFSSTPISAFGFYGTDISDSLGDLYVDLTDINGVVTSHLVIEYGSGNDGNVLFWGFIDAGMTYTQVALRNTSGDDRFGFDDMVIGDRGQITTVPVPGTIALLGLGILGLGFARKKNG